MTTEIETAKPIETAMLKDARDVADILSTLA